MRLSLLCLMLGALPAFGQVEPVAVYTQFDHPPESGVVGAMQKEVENILAPGGIRFDWKSLEDETDRAVTEELAVVSFKGTCTGGGVPDHFSEGALGWTHVSDGAILPFADVDCDRIRGFLKTKLTPLDPREQVQILGRAMARVLVHELFHILTMTRHHGSEGLDQSSFSVRELIEERFHGTEEVQILDPANPAVKGEFLRKESTTPQHGKVVFEKQGCGSCHGAKGEGTKRAPALTGKGKRFNSVTLAAWLSKDAHKMVERARQLKVPRPTLAEKDVRSLVNYLNTAF